MTQTPPEWAGFESYHLRFMHDAPKDFTVRGTAGFWQHPAAPEGEEILLFTGGSFLHSGMNVIPRHAPGMFWAPQRELLGPCVEVAFFPTAPRGGAVAEVLWANSAAPPECYRTEFKRVRHRWRLASAIGWEAANPGQRRKVTGILDDKLAKLAHFCAEVSPDAFPFSHHRGLADLLARSHAQLGEMYLNP